MHKAIYAARAEGIREGMGRAEKMIVDRALQSILLSDNERSLLLREAEALRAAAAENPRKTPAENEQGPPASADGPAKP
jgi:hypothetical protein